MCFPFLFRGTLDCGARVINDEMKMAVATTLAEIAREPVPKEVERAYAGRKFTFGGEYIIPTPFDPRLLYRIPKAVIKAAMATGTATK
jgi:malate dehydrogenase (oxaloacetate-decarboxylating)(NADP+)